MSFKESDNELYRCREWLCQLPMEDARRMQQTPEFQAFIDAFHQMEQKHRELLSSSITTNGNQNQDDHDEIINIDNNFKQMRIQQVFSMRSGIADEIILRVLDFLDSVTLARLGQTCRRVCKLCEQNVTQRTAPIENARQLTNSYQLLRAKEQIQGIGLSPHDKHVRIPTLLLGRRVHVTGCGDPEFNGVYFCTGCNGNGFIFTKPREPIQRTERKVTRQMLSDDLSLDSTTEAEMDDFVEGDEGLPLRCILAKRFSNETILWYMSKEVLATSESEDDNVRIGDIKQIFCFWARLMVVGDASSDTCRYPSQTSILLRQGGGWESLSTTLTIEPPVVELLD